MRAVRIREPGAPEVLELCELEAPAIAPRTVRVKVAAVGVNRADLMQRRGRYPAPPGVLADVPGLEFAGTVIETGPGADRFAPGDAVMGLVAGGGYAEEVVVHEREAIAVPPGFELAAAAAVPEVFLTAYDALTQLRVRAGDRVMVHAVGSGVGTAAIQLIAWMGATSVGTSRTAEKLERARALGLDEALHITDATDFSSRVEPVHAIVDLVGGVYFAESLACLRSRGRLLIVGLSAGVKAELSLMDMLRRRLQVTGTNLRSRPVEEKIDLARRFEEHAAPQLGRSLKPVVDRVLPFEDVVEAHRVLEANANFGKVVLRW
ncbi:MAG: NAD(P)H-quinone oxidoreductase [Myxococcota bacterium]